MCFHSQACWKSNALLLEFSLAQCCKMVLDIDILENIKPLEKYIESSYRFGER